MKKYFLIVVIALVLIVLGMGTYVVLFAQSFANNLKIIEIRNEYFKRAYDLRSRFGTVSELDNYTLLRSPIRVFREYHGRYVYGFTGTIVDVDWESERGVVHFFSTNGREYTFALSNVNGANGVRGVSNTGIKTIYSFDSHNPDERYSIGWYDGRKLGEILQQTTENPGEPINQSTMDIIYIMKLGE